MLLRELAKLVGGWEVGCSDHGCIWGHPGSMGTNGGCNCLKGYRADSLAGSQAIRQMKEVADFLNSELQNCEADQ